MVDGYISPEDFSTLPPDEQVALVRQYIMEMSVEDRKIVKKLIDIEKAEDP